MSVFRLNTPTVTVSRFDNTLYSEVFQTSSAIWDCRAGEPWTMGGSFTDYNNSLNWTCTDFLVHEVRHYNTALSDAQVSEVVTSMGSAWQ